MRAARWISRGIALCTLAGISAVSTAQAPQLTSVEFSTDAAVVLGGVALTAENVAVDDLVGGVGITTTGFPLLPAGTNIDAFERLPNGDVLLSLAVGFTPAFPPSAVISVTRGGAITYVFGSPFEPLPPGTNVDAVARVWRDEDLLLSFADPLVLGGVALDDEDLVRIDSVTGAASMAFDGSAAGVPVALDLDAADISPFGELWLSFDGAGVVPGSGGPVAFADEDVLAYDPDTGFFELAYDGSAAFAAWGPVNLDAFSNPDSDGDGFADSVDNCPYYVQLSLLDADGDGRGDECPEFTGVEFSTDAAVALGGVALTAEDVAADDLPGGVAISGVGIPIPPGVNIDAFERLPTGVTLYSVSAFSGTPGDPGPSDVIAVFPGGGTLNIFPFVVGNNVDAVAMAADGDLLLSFSDEIALGEVTVSDEDVVRNDVGGAGSSLAFDGSAEGIAEGLDLDAVDISPSGELWLSFDGSGVVDGVSFDDEDVLAFDPDTGNFELAYDGSAEYAAWAPVNLDAFSNPDSDGDGFADVIDNCPYRAQKGLRDTNRSGRGDECKCSDQNGDGTVDVNDLTAINTAIYNPVLVTPLCDGNNDGRCDVNDILAANVEIFSPTNTSTCARQPVPGP